MLPPLNKDMLCNLASILERKPRVMGEPKLLVPISNRPSKMHRVLNKYWIEDRESGSIGPGQSHELASTLTAGNKGFTLEITLGTCIIIRKSRLNVGKEFQRIKYWS